MPHFSPLTGEWTVVTHEYDASTGLRTRFVYNTGAMVEYTYDGWVVQVGSATKASHLSLGGAPVQLIRETTGLCSRSTCVMLEMLRAEGRALLGSNSSVAPESEARAGSVTLGPAPV